MDERMDGESVRSSLRWSLTQTGCPNAGTLLSCNMLRKFIAIGCQRLQSANVK